MHICEAPSAYLSVDSECAALLLQLNCRDARHLPRLLNVGTVGSDGEAHQVLADFDFLLVRRRQLLTCLGLAEADVARQRWLRTKTRDSSRDSRSPPGAWMLLRCGTLTLAWCGCCGSACR